MLFGMFLILTGLGLLLRSSGLLSAEVWQYLFPIILILWGLTYFLPLKDKQRSSRPDQNLQ